MDFIGGEIRRNEQCPLDSAEQSEAEDGQSLDCRPKPALPEGISAGRLADLRRLSLRNWGPNRPPASPF